ncbi:hypothetical protein CcI49_17080 [Frankia sp. CcI49]|uniref:hypothetical protein n=1 Tax=Frankia sp. CcI49 TaxID=1745382 RepID=UPI000976580E|nr:hypothetical protein [Frankia sp. CcI49]ONH59655.1 hypothetical protein CcI49_17080 [Frankia sp. CcI49]
MSAEDCYPELPADCRPTEADLARVRTEYSRYLDDPNGQLYAAATGALYSALRQAIGGTQECAAAVRYALAVRLVATGGAL